MAYNNKFDKMTIILNQDLFNWLICNLIYFMIDRNQHVYCEKTCHKNFLGQIGQNDTHRSKCLITP